MTPIPEKVLSSIEQVSLPAMPQVLHQLMRAMDDEGVAYARLAQIVGQDTALAARVLAAANSAALARRRGRITTLEECLMALGLSLVKTITISLAVQQVFDGLNGDARCDLRDFWAHSLHAAEIARLLAGRTGFGNPEEAYLGGLLHDVGELVLLAGLPTGYAMLLRLSADETALVEHEARLLGTTHAAVGAWLVDQWQLDSFLGDSLLFHHNQAREVRDAHALVRIVWSASLLAGIALMPDADGVARLEEVTGIDRKALMDIREQAATRVAELAAALGIAVEPVGAGLGCDAPPRALPRLAGQASQRPDGAGAPVPAPEAELVEAVREVALMQPLQRALFAMGSDQEILLALWESARILLGLPKLCFFLVDEQRGVLSGRDVGVQPALLRELEVPLDASRSLIAASTVAGGPLCSHDQDNPRVLSVIDYQVVRALQCEGMLCVPMIAADRLVGVMVFGLSSAQYARTRRRLTWLANYARLAAASLDSSRTAAAREKRLELELADRFQMQARRIVHEAGNPLGIIKNYLRILSQKLASENPLQQELGVLNEEIDRIAQIVRRLSEMPREGADAEVDVNELVREMLALYGESLFANRSIAVEAALAGGLAPLRTDRDSLKQVLLNLWKNAAEAMEEGGRLAIVTADGSDAEGRPCVAIGITDSGPGVPREVMGRLFQPVPSRTRAGQDGLGLAIVHAIVQRLGGRVSCRSQPGEGTTFTLLLPRHAPAQGRTDG